MQSNKPMYMKQENTLGELPGVRSGLRDLRLRKAVQGQHSKTSRQICLRNCGRKVSHNAVLPAGSSRYMLACEAAPAVD